MNSSPPYRSPSPPPSNPRRETEGSGGVLVAAMCVLYAAVLLGTGSAIVSTGIALILSAITIGVVGRDERVDPKQR